MPDEKPKADKTAAAGRPSQSATQRASEENPPEVTEEARYEVEYLTSHARALLNSNGSVVAGALAGQKAKTFTLAQAEDLVTKYLERPVEIEGNLEA